VRTTDDAVPWERVAGESFPAELKELSRARQNRVFHPVDAGTFVFSIQASAAHSSTPAAPVPPAEVRAWEVAIFDGDGRQLVETADPELISLPREWVRYWKNGVGRYVPTEVVRVVLQRFTLGPEHFDRFILEGSDPD
jgi:hypothetical protein